MSPATSSKSKDKKSARVHVNANGGITSNGYNPLSGTFHTFECLPASTASSPNVNGRFRTIDDLDDHNGSTTGDGVEYDTVSNNGSWSGKSDDHKEKPFQSLNQEPVPGADNDKREKMRLKNERKHQRQKERRAQELHERCSGYLMSRKLEALAQQLVAMGFSSERATMALILNEGRVEDSVSWLFDGGVEDKNLEHNLDTGENLKIDISEELAKITDMESKYTASKQEVERAIVACEGDIEKAEEMLKAPKQEHITTADLKSQETRDSPTATENRLTTSVGQTVMGAQSKALQSAGIQQTRDERDLDYTKVAAMLGPLVDHGLKGSMQTLRKIPPKVDQRWPSVGSNPSVSYSAASSLQAPIEAPFTRVGDDLKKLQLGSMREPIIVMQRPQSLNAKQVPSSTSAGSSPPGTAMVWHPSNNGFARPPAISAIPGHNGVNSHPVYNQLQFQPQKHNTSHANGLWNRGGASSASPTLSAASSLGLFSGFGTNGSSASSSSSSPVDWKSGSSMVQFDYTNIDWSLDLRSLTSRSNRLCSQHQHQRQRGCYGVGNGNGIPVEGGGVVGSSSEPIPRQFEFVSSPSL